VGVPVERFARTVLRARWLVIAAWLAALVAGMVAAAAVPDRLSYDFSLPGQEGYETSVKLQEAYGTTYYPSAVPVFTAPAGQTIEQHRDDVTAVTNELRKIPGIRVIDYGTTGDRAFLTDDGRSTFAFVYGPQPQGFVDTLAPRVEQTVETAAAQHGLESSITGYVQLSEGSEDSEGPSVLTETLLGAVGALVVLIFVFASFLALVPMLVAAVSILTTFLIVLGLTTFTDVAFVVQFLISLVGLGVAIDYSLLVVSRWREERAHGATNDDAIVTAVRTAGHAVLASGVTVAISLIALIVVPVPLLRSMGFGGMLIPVVSVAVVLTLLPALLKIAPWVDFPRIRKEDKASRAWSAWAGGVVRFRWVAAGVALAALALAIAPVFGIQFGQASSASLASNGKAVDTLHQLRDGGVGTGVITPIKVLVEDGDPAAFVDAAEKVDGVRAAVAWPAGRDGAVDVEVIPDVETVDNNSVATVTAVRDAVKDLPGYDGVAGSGADVLDYDRAVYDRFPLVLAVIAIVTFILLVRTFRSLLLPLKAVVLNLVSVAAVFGVATWFWQEGNGSEAIFGITETGAMTFWLPVLIFAFLFGLSMDYEVFILARMREEYDRTGSTSIAVREGLGRTGRLVTAAALILFFAFSALAGIPSTDIKVMATALGVGILLDATLIRALLVPALVSLFGRWNWWLPASVAKVLRVEPSPLAPRGADRAVLTGGDAEPEREPVRTG
jgi:RND superfamily putative drug exporter